MFTIYSDNDLLQYMCTYTLYNNIAYNNNNCYLSVTKILMYFTMSLLCYISFCLLSLICLNLNLQTEYAALISAYIITMI